MKINLSMVGVEYPKPVKPEEPKPREIMVTPKPEVLPHAEWVEFDEYLKLSGLKTSDLYVRRAIFEDSANYYDFVLGVKTIREVQTYQLEDYKKELANYAQKLILYEESLKIQDLYKKSESEFRKAVKESLKENLIDKLKES